MGNLSKPSCNNSKRHISLPFMEESMILYCKNATLCRRKVLFEDFDEMTSLKDSLPVVDVVMFVLQIAHNQPAN